MSCSYPLQPTILMGYTYVLAGGHIYMAATVPCQELENFPFPLVIAVLFFGMQSKKDTLKGHPRFMNLSTC